jgi:hypothetical protein
METNEAATTELLGKLQPNKFPGAELGTADPQAVALLAGGPDAEEAWAQFGATIGVPALGNVAPPAPAAK